MEKIDSIKILDERNMKLVLSKKFMIEPSQCLNTPGSAEESSSASQKRPPKRTHDSELIETCGKLDSSLSGQVSIRIKRSVLFAFDMVITNENVTSKKYY